MYLYFNKLEQIVLASFKMQPIII